jgi:outer membrane protein
MRKTSLIISFLLLVVAFVADSTTAQGIKIGFVRDDVIQTQYSGFQRAQEQWNLEYKAWEDEALAKQKEIEDLLSEYDKQKLILSEEKRAEKEAAIRAKQEALDAYTRQIFSPGGTAEKKQDALISPVLEKANKAIEAVAIEGDYDVIFTYQSGLGFIKESYDVTDKVLEHLEKQEQ